VARSTVAPPPVIRLPLTSRSVTVTVEVDVPFAGSVFGLAVIVELAPNIGPATRVICAVSSIRFPLSIPLMTAGLPAVKIGLLYVAVYVPLPLFVTTPKVPTEAASVTVEDPVVIRLPSASRRRTVTKDVLMPLAISVVGLASIVDVAVDATPAPITTAAEGRFWPLTVPLIVAVPVVSDDVRIAVNVPFPLLVTLPRLPRFVLSSTTLPPDTTKFPFTSRKVTVTVEVDVPFAGMVFGLAVRVEFAPLATPAVRVIEAVSKIVLPFNVPDMTAGLPDVDVGLVNVAVYVPLLLSITNPRVPLVVAKTIVAPPVVSKLPSASRSRTVIVDVLVPFATRLVGLASIVVVAVEATPAPIVTVAVGRF